MITSVISSCYEYATVDDPFIIFIYTVNYLHIYISCRSISHRHNILLDETFTPKVADFGFLTPVPPKIVGTTSLMTVAGAISLAGTRGYVAPEYNDGRRGPRTDVYSYGIVSLFMIVCIV